VGVNTVPERATIEIDRRLGPDEPPETACAQFVDYVAQHADIGRCRVKHDPPFMQSGGLSASQNKATAERLVRIVGEHGRRSELVGVPYATDAPAIAETGVPTVVFGPGSIDQAHTADEFIALEELRLGADIFFKIATTGLRTENSG
jgi:acetylornithine deacetylase